MEVSKALFRLVSSARRWTYVNATDPMTVPTAIPYLSEVTSDTAHVACRLMIAYQTNQSINLLAELFVPDEKRLTPEAKP